MSFTCPRCSATSHHPTDEAEGYCGACHDWTGNTSPRLPWTGLPANLPPGRHPLDNYLRALANILGKEKAAAFLGVDPDTGELLERRPT